MGLAFGRGSEIKGGDLVHCSQREERERGRRKGWTERKWRKRRKKKRRWNRIFGEKQVHLRLKARVTRETRSFMCHKLEQLRGQVEKIDMWEIIVSRFHVSELEEMKIKQDIGT